MWFDMFLELIYDGKKKKKKGSNPRQYFYQKRCVMKLYQIIYPKHNLMRRPKYWMVSTINGGLERVENEQPIDENKKKESWTWPF